MPTAANFYHPRVRVVRARMVASNNLNTYARVRLSEKWPPVAAVECSNDIKDRYKSN